MSHFGMLCPTATGHLNPMMTLGRELKRRGHQVTFYQLLDTQSILEKAGFSFRAYGVKEYPVGTMKNVYTRLGNLTGRKALTFTIKLIAQRTAVCLRDLPAMLREDKIDALLVDQIAYEGKTLSELLGIPYITVSNALVLNPEKNIPPFFKTWGYQKSIWSQARNQLAYSVFAQLTRPIVDAVNEYRKKHDLPVHPYDNQGISPLAQLSQQIAEFDFPRQKLPKTFHYAGPFHDERTSSAIPFDFDQLDGRPLIYASMGTLQNQHMKIFKTFAQATADLPVQLVISLGGGGDPDEFRNLPGSPRVVRYAPQIELLRRAALCITHAGLNTALESLAKGVPMVAIPITNDQPGVAARIQWTGCGKLIPLAKLNPSNLRNAIETVMQNLPYQTQAKRLQERIRLSQGVKRAIDVVEGIVG